MIPYDDVVDVHRFTHRRLSIHAATNVSKAHGAVRKRKEARTTTTPEMSSLALFLVLISSLLRWASAGTIPRQIECYSCMSLSYQNSWDHLQSTYHPPKVFTNRCNDPSLQKNIPTTLCGSVCVSLLEPDVEAGVFIGYKYIRGCLDRLLRNGFNQTALRTHRFNQIDQCRSLPRSHLFNPVRGMNQPMFGDVQLCSCYGEKCNGAASSVPSSLRWSPLTIAAVLVISWMLS
ncbi:hypothetical protein L596_028303 [Steinernema carpocapsae]|uniref:Protein quiver n=1 Tax=Steinernema carpocapsae TaxID=34508 RepID=A0A4U5LY14_STECR|nr:hypothetical protein L596_028303 [Steinernema carpocapsae]